MATGLTGLLPSTTINASSKGTYKDMMGYRESGDRYGITNQLGYAGRYQMGGGALRDAGYKDKNYNWTGKDGINSMKDFLADEDLQEKVMDGYTDRNIKKLQKEGVWDMIGQDFNGEPLTQEGLLAASHLVGAGAVSDWVVNGKTPKNDANGTRASEYMRMGNRYNGLQKGSVFPGSNSTLQPDANHPRHEPSQPRSTPKLQTSKATHDRPASLSPTLKATVAREGEVADPNRPVRPELQNFQKPEYQTFDEKAQEQKELDKASPEPSAQELIKAVGSRTQVASGIARRFERRNQTEGVEGYEIPPETLEELAGYLSADELKDVREAHSEEDLRRRLVHVDNDREEWDLIGRAGIPGTLLAVGSGIVDPMFIGSAIATQGVGAVHTTSRISNALRIGALASTENALGEYIMLADTQKDYNDVILAGTVGLAFGTAIGSFLTPMKPKVKLGSEGKVGEAEGADELVNLASRNAQEARDANAINIATEVVQRRKAPQHARNSRNKQVAQKRMDKAVIKRDMELNSIPTHKPLPNKFLKQLNTNITKHKNDLVENTRLLGLEMKRISNTNWYPRIKGDGRKKAIRKVRQSLYNKAKADAVSAELAIHGRIARVQAKIDANAKHVDDIKARDAWNKLDSNQKQDILFPEMRKEAVAKRKADGELRKTEHEANVKANKDKQAKDVQQKKDNLAKLKKELGEKAGIKSTKVDSGNKSAGAQATVDPEGDLFTAPQGAKDYEIYSEMLEQASTVTPNWKRYIPKWLQSDYTRVSASWHPSVRALAVKLLSNPQQGGRNVATDSALAKGSIRKAVANSYDEGYRLYASENKISLKDAEFNTATRNEYDVKLVDAIRSGVPDADLPKSLQIARKGHVAGFKKAGEELRASGVKGFENLNTKPTYWPDVVDTTKATDLLITNNWKDSDMIQLFSNGYRKTNDKLSEKQGYILGLFKHRALQKANIAPGMDMAVFRESSLSDAKTFFKHNGMSDKEIEDFFENVLTEMDWQSVSNRARKSLNIDWESTHTAQGNTLKVGDFMTTDVNKTMLSYTNEASALIGMGKNGIDSMGRLDRMLTQARADIINDAKLGGSLHSGKFNDDGSPIMTWRDGGDPELAKQAMQDIERIERNIDLIRGKSPIDYSKASNRGLRNMRGITSLGMLQQVGFASLSEISNTISQVGLMATIKAVPGMGVFRVGRLATGRDGESLTHLNRRMEEIEQNFGFLGETNFESSTFKHVDDVGADASSKVGQIIDRMLQRGQEIQGVTSLFNWIQEGASKINMNAISGRILDDMLGKELLEGGKLFAKGSFRKQIEVAGLTPQRYQDIAKWVRANRHADDATTGVDTFNLNNMPNDMRDDLMSMMHSLQNSNIQKQLPGELNTDLMGNLGVTSTQFLSFVIGAVEKNVARGMRHDKAGWSAGLLWSMGLSYIAHGAQTHLRALGKPEDQRDDYIESRMTGVGLTHGIMNKSSHLATTGLVLDIGLMTGAAPQQAYPEDRLGNARGGIASAIPMLQMIDNNVAASQAFFQGGYGVLEGEDVGDAFADFHQKGQRAAVGQNIIWFGEFMKTAQGLNDK